MPEGNKKIPNLALSKHVLSASEGALVPKMSPRGTMMSSSKTKYTLTPRTASGEEQPQRLTPRNMRSIQNFVEFNKKLQHHHRANKLTGIIPDASFVKLLDNADANLGLRLAPVHPKESALDTQLRLEAPETYHCPKIAEPRSTSTMSTRMVNLLKGISAVPQHWGGEKEGTEKDISHNNVLRDYELRAMVAKRGEKPFQEALAHFSLGSLHFNAGTMEKAITSFNVSADLFEQIGDAQGCALCHNLVGVCYNKLAQCKMSLIHHKKQESLSGSYGRAVAQINIGVCYAVLGEQEYAEQAFCDALSNAIEGKDAVLETIALGNVGVANMRIGDMKKAQTHIEKCLEHCSLAGDKVGAAVCLLLLGEIYSQITDHAHAQFYYEHSYRIAEESRCDDLAEMARVCVGVARGNQKIKEAMVATATSMGKEFSMTDVLLCLPKNT